jgi:ribosomal protein S8
MYIKFTIFFYKNLPFFKKILNISTLSKSFYITYKTLKLLRTVFKSSLIILSTPYGLVSHKEATSIGSGGKIIYIIL